MTRMSSVMRAEFTFGKEEKGRDIAAETASEVPRMRAGANVGFERAVWETKGIITMAATEWETTEPTVTVTRNRMRKRSVGEDWRSFEEFGNIKSARCVRRPDEVTISPRMLPPPSRNKMCQVKELNSTSESIPVPNMTTMKTKRMAPSPTPNSGSRKINRSGRTHPAM